MAFNLKSGNRPNFRKLGSNSHKPSMVSKSRSPLMQRKTPTVEEWNKGEHKSSLEGIDKGRSIIEADLKTKAYEDRLNREIEMFGGEDAKITKAVELSRKSKGGTEDIKNPTSEQILEIRQKRLADAIWNDPSLKTKEGGYVGYGKHDARRLLTPEESKSLGLKDDGYVQYMPSSNIYLSDTNLRTGEPFNWSDTEGVGQDPEKQKQLAIHEGTHAVTGGTMNMLPGTQSFLNKAKGGSGKEDQFDDSELAKPQEVYARYKSTQNFLQENGIFDYQSGDEFTDKHVKQIEKLMEGATLENRQEKGIPYDVFTFFGEEGDKGNKKISKKDMKTIFNNVATNEPDPGQMTDDFGNQQTFA